MKFELVANLSCFAYCSLDYFNSFIFFSKLFFLLNVSNNFSLNEYVVLGIFLLNLVFAYPSFYLNFPIHLLFSQLSIISSLVFVNVVMVYNLGNCSFRVLSPAHLLYQTLFFSFLILHSILS